MPTGTWFNPKNINEFDKNALNYAGVGVNGSAGAGTSTNIDHKVTDDSLITGAQVLTETAAYGDTISFQVVDVDGILAPAGTVFNQFIYGWRCRSDSQEQINLQVNYPAKIPAGLYLRLIYYSTGASAVSVSINYSLHKVLQ